MSGRVKDEPAGEMLGLDLKTRSDQMSGFCSSQETLFIETKKERKTKKDRQTSRVSFFIAKCFNSHPQWPVSFIINHSGLYLL